MIHLIAIGMYLQTHVVGVLLAIIVSVIVGFLWHGVLFNKQWARLSKLENLTDAQKKETMIPGLGASVLMAFVQAAVIGRTFQILMMPSVLHAFIIPTILWVPFTGLVMLNNYVWSRKPITLLLIDAGYTLVSLWAISAVLYATM